MPVNAFKGAYYFKTELVKRKKKHRHPELLILKKYVWNDYKTGRGSGDEAWR